jgi:hypothetical protein
MTVQSSLSEGLQADIDLRVRGSAAPPGVLGRIDVTAENWSSFATSRYAEFDHHPD